MDALWAKARKIARRAIKAAEGKRLEKYKCPANEWTIGYGHQIKPGSELFTGKISSAKAERLLTDDIQDAALIVQTHFPGAVERDTLNAERLAVLIEMAFCLGSSRLWKFSDMRSAVEYENWTWAGAEIQNSRWYWVQGAKSPGIRVRLLRLKGQLRSGKVAGR